MSVSISGDGSVTGIDQGLNVVGVVTATTLNVGTGVSISSPATNVLTLGTNNSERVRIDSSGRVGIGTDNPSQKLHVRSVIRIDGSTNPYIVLNDGTNTGYIQIADGRLDLNHNGSISFAPGGGVKATINTSGNLVFAGSGQGIDFSATANSSGTTTSELLSDYEEGTWTPVDGSGAGLTFQASTDGYYIKIGRLVHCWGRVTYPSTSNTNSNIIIGFPFTNISGNIIYSGTLNITNINDNGLLPMMEGNNIQFRNRANTAFTNAQLSGKFFYFEFNMLTAS